MKARPTVSVCIPTVPGRERELHRAIASVQDAARQYPDWAPIQCLVERDPDRTGAAATRNRLLARASGDVIAWLDDDDWLSPAHLAVCARVLHEQPDVDLVYPVPIMEPQQGHGDGRRFPVCPAAVTYQGVFPTSPWGLRWCDEFAAHLRRHGSFIPMTHLVRRDVLVKAGGFPEGRTLADGRYQGEDERMLIALLDSGAVFHHVDRKTWHWFVNPKSTAGKGVAR